MLDMARTREVFEASTDFTLAVEEEFQLLDPETLSLTQRYTELREATDQDPVLLDAVAGELIESEIEIRSGRCESWGEVVTKQQEARNRLFRVAPEQGITLGATATHPWSAWQDQKIIQTEHYRRVAEGLKYVAWRNNTFGIHVHVGIRGADRAIAVCDRLRPLLPELLAVSANSPFVDGRDSGLHSARSQIFTRNFPRCGVPDHYGSFQAYADYVEFLTNVNSIVEATQIWWSIRPHHSFGTVELRICDAQTSGDDSLALAGLLIAAIAQAAMDEDEGVPFAAHPPRMIEENFWRAIRYGLDGNMIDLDRLEEYPAAALPERLLDWTAPARSALGIDVAPPSENGAQRQRRAIDAGKSVEEIFKAEVQLTQSTYSAMQPAP
ncbi:MAG: glutamate---cysteine ligase / carboxylate-amine ligase [Thermoleophilaceae bacterium]|jgi:carboxylate-amine ligase|nr:glutamate---cysteine ligase / carboxylate-amine ligase [Thermoleophilaceae bacterium]